VNPTQNIYYTSVILILNVGVNCKPRCSAQSDNGDKGSRKQCEDGWDNE
jgi:hypothetical protein